MWLPKKDICENTLKGQNIFPLFLLDSGNQGHLLQSLADYRDNEWNRDVSNHKLKGYSFHKNNLEKLLSKWITTILNKKTTIIPGVGWKEMGVAKWGGSRICYTELLLLFLYSKYPVTNNNKIYKTCRKI